MSSKTASTHLRLDRYVAILALDRARMKAFLSDPERQMEALGLSKRQQKLMLDPGVYHLFEHLHEVQPVILPLPAEQPGDG